jgi:hypothetical protein
MGLRGGDLLDLKKRGKQAWALMRPKAMSPIGEVTETETSYSVCWVLDLRVAGIADNRGC